MLGKSAGTEQAEDPRSLLDSSIPQNITNDLTSPDARVRYRALDHWEDKGSKAPLDPVFEAMEDEDEDVREKATTIVEQRWAEEQEMEDG
jgi:HEAT repeat protein